MAGKTQWLPHLIVWPLLAFGVLALILVSYVGDAADLLPRMGGDYETVDKLIEAKPDCAEATDQCRVCMIEAGKPSCSNIGISCQPLAWRCTKTKPDEAKPDEKKL
jgi:hypothetical protein